MSSQDKTDTDRPQTTESAAGADSGGGVTGSNAQELVQAVEAILFAADEPIEAQRIVDIMSEVRGGEGPSIEDVQEVLHQLNAEYDRSGRAFRIQEWGKGYRLATRSEVSPFVKSLYVGQREESLSRSLLETLAVIAYRQPVTRPEVDFVRGVQSDYAIRKLMDLGLVDVGGRADSLGRPLLYETTDRFLEAFGLRDLDELPTLQEAEELLEDPEFEEERSTLLQLDVEEGIDFINELQSEDEESE